MIADVAANVRALQYALSHPLVYRDHPKDLQIPQPPLRPLTKVSNTYNMDLAQSSVICYYLAP